MPKRVRIDWRKPGGRKPSNVVVVARPSRWGNPFKVGEPDVPDRATAVRKFAVFLISEANIEAVRDDLRGKDLACYCPLDQPCHADVLLKIANDE